MNRTMIFLLIVFILTAPLRLDANPQAILDFKTLMEILRSGGEVRCVIHYGQCQLISGNAIKEKSPEAVGGMAIGTWEFFAAGAIRNPKAFLVASESTLIRNPIGDGYVYNYAKLRLEEDGKASLQAQYLNTTDMSVRMDETFHTRIFDGTTGAVHLYRRF